MRPSGVHVSGLQNPAPSSSTLDTLSFQTIDPVLQSFPPGAYLHGNHSRRPRINDSLNVTTLIDGVTTANRARSNHSLCFPPPVSN